MSGTMDDDIAAHVLQTHVDAALKEDLNDDSLTAEADRTSALLIPSESRCSALIVAKQSGIIAGTALAEAVFRRLDQTVECEVLATDGSAVDPGVTVMTMKGSARALLTAERTALNFLQHLSGIATYTRCFVDAIANSPNTRITDTRKTTPGLRILEKYAVTQGGGVNHRMGLFDAVLIKENHAAECGGVAIAVKKLRCDQSLVPGATPLMVETRRLAEVESLLALPAPERPDRILLDNMPPDTLLEAVALIRSMDGQRKIEIEATGGVALETVAAIAATGVDLISIGALTHSAPALDLSLLVGSVVA